MDPTMRGTVAKLRPSRASIASSTVRGAVLYIGRTTDLRHRVASYWSDLGDRDHLARMVRRVGRIEAVSCDSQHEAAWLGRNLLETALPLRHLMAA